MRTFFFHPTVTTLYRGKPVTRRATVAAIQDPNVVDSDGNPITHLYPTFVFGVSICSDKDQFVKKYGRSSALGKAQSKHPAFQLKVEYSDTDLSVAKNANKFFLDHAIGLLATLGYTVVDKYTTILTE